MNEALFFAVFQNVFVPTNERSLLHWQFIY